ncbi:conserved membrane hypothetical protein [Acidobacteriia bacterium SbA2]|nr:conserved membrane hypothetical protein [Acidobacteriia bacterium SbA2]
MVLLIDCGLAVAALVAGFAFPRAGTRGFETCERAFGKLAQNSGLSVLVVGLTALVLRAAVLPVLPIPQPAAADEYGYLLLGDTFAHGRVTNPTHPMWVHFESFHIIWQPTYTAKYYPLQGLVLALGRIATGHPFWGVWLSVGLMCAAICWMLEGWMPPGWALLGGFLAAIRLGTFSYWANSYWGGAVAATGGALVLGALPRIKPGPRVRDALLMGLGLAILANSRPYEGMFLGLPVAVALGFWILGKKRPPLWSAVKRVVAPLALVLVLTGCAMGWYFWRTTGSPWRTPYLVYEATYNPAPYFPWQSLRQVSPSRHQVMRDWYRDAVADYEKSRTFPGFVAAKVGVAITLWYFYLGGALTLPLLLAPAVAGYGLSWKSISPNTRFLLLAAGTGIVGSMLPVWFLAHYAAPITSAILALVMQALRRLRSYEWRGKPTGLFVTRAVPTICLILLAVRIFVAHPLHLSQACGTSNLERANLLARLEQCPGRQLVIVRYSPSHEISLHEWVYNEADIDRAKVIWARDMGAAQNAELIDYFKERHAWLLEPDETPPRLTPYSVARPPVGLTGGSQDLGTGTQGHS